MEQLEITDPKEILMIGDRENDVLGAKENGVGTYGALWGFGDEEELMRAGALACFADAASLGRAILRTEENTAK